MLRLMMLAASLTSIAWAHPCATCHPREVRQYLQTGMAKSLSLPVHQPSGSFTQQLSNTTFRIESTDAGMKQTAQRAGARAEYPVEYVVGSGNHAFAYLVRIADYLFQSPISFYTAKQVWDMAPGYERDRHPDFTRPVTADCLGCHAGSSFPAGGLNRYKPPIVGSMPISCDRCHGPVEPHLQAPSRSNIINPARLPARARDSVCEQCHLTGEARVTNPGRTFADFRAGQDLESVYSTYVFDTSAADRSIKVVSHAEQLRKSVCALRSGDKLWCGTCHNPHLLPTDTTSYYRDRCLGCHGQKLLASHPQPANDCVGCHMPRRPAIDGGHTAFTDHRIQRTPIVGDEASKERLTPWREPPAGFAQRNLALAYLAVGERDESPVLLAKAEQLLGTAHKALRNDPEITNALGVVLLRKGNKAESEHLLKQAVEALPSSAPYRINLATVLMERGDYDAATEQLNTAIASDRSLEIAYRRLVEIYTREGNTEAVKSTLRRYLDFRPQSLEAQAAVSH